jgi:hypothetical protein
MQIIDAAIIDRVFQPIVDWTGWSCFRLGRFFIDGAAVMLAFNTVHDMMNDWAIAPLYAIILVATGAMLIVYRSWIALLERQHRTGTMNIGRQTMMLVRLISIILFIFNTTEFLQAGHRFWIAIGYGSWMISLYFSSCCNRPPRFQFQREPLTNPI